MAERDPYSKTLDVLWAALHAKPEWTALVKPANEIAFMGEMRSPIKENAQTSDYPMAAFRITSSLANSVADSATRTDLVTFQLVLSSGDQRLDAIYLPLRWAAFLALAPVATTEAMKLSHYFVKRCRLMGAQDGKVDPEIGGPVKGWSGLWNVEVLMAFSASSMLTNTNQSVNPNAAPGPPH